MSRPAAATAVNMDSTSGRDSCSGGKRFPEQLAAGTDDRQQVVDVVGDAASEATHRFHPLGVAQLLLTSWRCAVTSVDDHEVRGPVVERGRRKT